MRAKFRQMFERNKYVKDVGVLDVLLLKGWQEYQETMNAWKQTSHVMKWFAEEEVCHRCMAAADTAGTGYACACATY